MSEQPPYASYPTHGDYPGQQFAPPPVRQNGLGIAGMVLGIVALVLFWTVIVGVICGVLAIIFGVIGRNRAKRGQATNGGQATAGLVTGIIAVVFVAGLFAIAAANGHLCFHVGSNQPSCNTQ